MTLLDDVLADLGITPERLGPLRCPRCGHPDSKGVTRESCRNGWCTTERCAACGHELLTYGPVGCRCEDGGPNPLAIDGRAYRRRTRRRRP